MREIVCIICVIIALLQYAPESKSANLTEHIPVPFMQDVKSAIRQAEARYESGNVSGAADLAKKILAKYPDNDDAKAILDKCLAKERDEYDDAINSLNVDKLSAFLAKYPSSTYCEEVNKYIADVPLWLDARNRNTLDSYNKYLTESAHLLYKQDANSAIKEITIKQAYNAAVAENTIKAFEKFRSDFPNSKYDKDASNKIARLLADKFNSKSTYAEKANALSYAKNEMTKDYVNNKFNKATQKTTSSTGSSKQSSRTSSSSYGTRTTSNRNNGTKYKTSSYSEETSIRFGISFLGELGLSSYYSTPAYGLGAGAQVRFGDHRYAFNMLVGGKYYYSVSNSKYYLDDYSSSVVSERSSRLCFTPQLNWNFYRASNCALFIGLGAQFGYDFLSQLETIGVSGSVGVSWKKGAWEFYYIKQIQSPISFPPELGTSLSFYF